MTYKDLIDKSSVPKHVAIIMDGNGRWAKRHQKPRVFGHQNGVRAVKQVTEAAAEIGIKYLTLYAFSKENWRRPKFEVNTLMKLFVKTVGKELNTLQENNIRLQAIGDVEALPDGTYAALRKAMNRTKHNDHMTLILALNYSARWEITHAAKTIAKDVQSGNIDLGEVNEDLFKEYLTTSAYPDPELIIRTSGEHRVSNFLLWQLSYSELFFSDVLWPDFTKEHLYEAIHNYQQRERRFGLTGEQLMKS